MLSRRISIFLYVSIIALTLVSCDMLSREKEVKTTPWGDVIDEEGKPIEEDADSLSCNSSCADIKDIVNSGELIVFTLTGPETYYDYHGHGMGLHYMLCERFAKTLGVSVRMEICKDTLEMVTKLRNGEGDIAAFPLQKQYADKYGVALSCVKNEESAAWALNKGNVSMAAELEKWFKKGMFDDVKKEIKQLLTYGFVKRHVYPFMLSQRDAVISRYDELFRKYASTAQCDWTLLASQCYQESCFDPHARSWAGACGLMQIMPGTADHLGLSRSQLFEVEPNIAAACRYMNELQGKFSDIRDRQERLKFALASYNGGYFHVRDAMALAQKYGKNPQRWNDVRTYILGLQESRYYNDPVVKNGYMRGSETADYVDRIIDRWRQYRHATKGKYSSGMNAVPTPSKRANKWASKS